MWWTRLWKLADSRIEKYFYKKRDHSHRHDVRFFVWIANSQSVHLKIITFIERVLPFRILPLCLQDLNFCHKGYISSDISITIYIHLSAIVPFDITLYNLILFAGISKSSSFRCASTSNLLRCLKFYKIDS